MTAQARDSSEAALPRFNPPRRDQSQGGPRPRRLDPTTAGIPSLGRLVGGTGTHRSLPTRHANLEQRAGRSQIPLMSNRPPELDMTIAGEYRTPPKPSFMTRVMIWAIVVAALAGAFALAAFALWLALIILPVAIGAAVVAWLIWRFQVWRGQRSVGGGPRRDIYRS